jgi:peptidoglycan/xylan/chitin deacetylase (PgdA/CDA1 family)
VDHRERITRPTQSRTLLCRRGTTATRMGWIRWRSEVKGAVSVARARRTKWTLAGPTVGFALVHALPSALILATFLERPPTALPGNLCRWRGASDRPQIAITFDDGPSLDTPRTLDLLEELGIQSTFFLVASQIRSYPDFAQEIVRRGHEVASHGFLHRRHLLSTPRAIREDFSQAMNVHKDIFGHTPRFYRPPYGQLSTVTLLEARRHGMEVVLWSRWGKEFAETDPDCVRRRLEPGLVPGAVLLLHDNDVSCRPGTAELTRRTLRPLRTTLGERGLAGVTMDQLTSSGTDLHEPRSVVRT